MYGYKRSGQNTHLSQLNMEGTSALGVRPQKNRQKIARNSPTWSDPSAMGPAPSSQRQEACPMFEAPDGNEGPTLPSGFFFEFLEGSSAHGHIVQRNFLRTVAYQPHTKKNVAADFGSRSDARSDHGRSRRSRAISRPQRPRDIKCAICVWTV